MSDKQTPLFVTEKVTAKQGQSLEVCVLIPCYNHGKMLASVLTRLAPFGLDVLIVDDGSDDSTRLEIERLSREPIKGLHGQVQHIRLPQNKGKGGAMVAGMAHLADIGYTHAIQVDADGQHQVEGISQLLEMAQQYPSAIISGQPAYDDSVPKSRLYGRYITHFWVWVETLSLSIKDSMCGFRVYPIAPFMALVNQGKSIGQRMDFDTEAMVRLYWAGVPSLFISTKVTYPEDGVSHFDVWGDNIRITQMHTRLFFGMLPRIPMLLWRNLNKKKFLNQAKQMPVAMSKQTPQHWAAQKERKGLWGMRFMLWVYKVLGRRVFKILLYPVVSVFWFLGREQRSASTLYLKRVQAFANTQGAELPKPLSSYQHMLRFAESMVDKIASWHGDIQFGRDIDWAKNSPAKLASEEAQGYLFLVSHLGDMEVCRALAQQLKAFKVNALVFNENAERFKQLMEESAPDASLNLISVQDVGPELAAELQERLKAGENVAIVGDRTSVSASTRVGERRVCWSSFLGELAPFPQGPFILASLLKCSVMLMFALKEEGKLHIYLEEFASPLQLPRGKREEALQQAIDRYAKRLEQYCLKAPLDWFNFFNFWQLPNECSNTDGCNDGNR